MTRDIAALVAFLDSRTDTPHAWGRTANDCVAFVCGAVMAQTGQHPLPADRFGDWTSERQAIRVLRRHGGLEAMADAVFARTVPALAQRGDIAAVADAALGVSLMIVEGATLVAPGDRGTVRLPRAAMIGAWNAAGLRDE